MPEVALYLFDGSNLFHAGRFAHRDELVDQLASFVAVRGARGVVVFDGVGEDREIGALSIRFAPHADSVLERLAAEGRARETVLPRHVRRRRPGNEWSGGAKARLRGVSERARCGVPPRGRAEPACRPRRPGDPCAPGAASPR